MNGTAQAATRTRDLLLRRHYRNTAWGEVNALFSLGTGRRLVGNLAGAAEAIQLSLEIGRDIGSRVGDGNALRGLGTIHRLAGDIPAVTEALEATLRVEREVGDRGGKVETLNEVGVLHLVRQDLDQAFA